MTNENKIAENLNQQQSKSQTQNYSLADNQQFLAFMLDEEIYGINVLKTREVLDYKRVTKVPRTPAYMMGILNLRGEGIPVIDLRIKFGMKKKERTVDTSIIIVETVYDEDAVIVGLMVDSVEEVIRFSEDKLEAPPKVGMKINSSFIQAIGKRKEDFIMLLAIERLFSDSEISNMEKLADSKHFYDDNKNVDMEQELDADPLSK